jgi:hypothetical protein
MRTFKFEIIQFNRWILSERNTTSSFIEYVLTFYFFSRVLPKGEIILLHSILYLKRLEISGLLLMLTIAKVSLWWNCQTRYWYNGENMLSNGITCTLTIYWREIYAWTVVSVSLHYETPTSLVGLSTRLISSLLTSKCNLLSPW